MRRTPIAAMSAKKRAARAADGDANPFSTLAGTTRKAAMRAAVAVKPKRPKNTGPKRSVVSQLKARSGGACEWIGCNRPATDKHHRLNRKAGGRHGLMAELVNGVEWLLHACRFHHAYVTSAHGVALERARRYGWLLLEGQDASVVPVTTRHHSSPVLLTVDGGWKPVGRVAA